jgi:hypothetical protein
MKRKNRHRKRPPGQGEIIVARAPPPHKVSPARPCTPGEHICVVGGQERQLVYHAVDVICPGLVSGPAGRRKQANRTQDGEVDADAEEEEDDAETFEGDEGAHQYDSRKRVELGDADVPQDGGVVEQGDAVLGGEDVLAMYRLCCVGGMVASNFIDLTVSAGIGHACSNDIPA